MPEEKTVERKPGRLGEGTMQERGWKSLNFWISAEEKASLDAVVEETGISISALMRRALRQEMRRIRHLLPDEEPTAEPCDPSTQA